MKRIFPVLLALIILSCQNPFSRPEALSDVSLIVELPYMDSQVASGQNGRLLSSDVYALEIILDIPGIPGRSEWVEAEPLDEDFMIAKAFFEDIPIKTYFTLVVQAYNSVKEVIHIGKKEVILLPTEKTKYEEYTIYLVPARGRYEWLELRETQEVYVSPERMSFYAVDFPNPGIQILEFEGTFEGSELFVQGPEGLIVAKEELSGEGLAIPVKTQKKGVHYLGFLNRGENDEGSLLSIIGAKDTTPPGEVEGAFLRAGDGQLELEWTNPEDTDGDFAGILLTDLGSRERIAELDPATNSYTWTGLNNDEIYEINIATFDDKGNLSPGVNLKGVPNGTGAPAIVVVFNSKTVANGATLRDNSLYNLGSGNSYSVTIQNRGTTDLEIIHLPSVVGDSDFTLNSPPTAGTLIPDGGSRVFDVDFTANDVRLRRGTLRIVTNDRNQPVDPNQDGEYVYEVHFESRGPGIWPVDPSGDDKGPGTLAQPFASPRAAVESALEDKFYNNKSVRLTSGSFDVPEPIEVDEELQIIGGYNSNFLTLGGGNSELWAVEDNNLILDIRNRDKNPVRIQNIDFYNTESRQDEEIGVRVQGKVDIIGNGFYADEAQHMKGIELATLDGNLVNITDNSFNLPLSEGGANFAYGIYGREGAAGTVTIDSNVFQGEITKDAHAAVMYDPKGNTITDFRNNTITMANAPYSYGFRGAAKELSLLNNSIDGYPAEGSTLAVSTKAVEIFGSSGLVNILSNQIILGTTRENTNYGLDVNGAVEQLTIKNNEIYSRDRERGSILATIGPETPWVQVAANRFQLRSSKADSYALINRSGARDDQHQIFANVFAKENSFGDEGLIRLLQLENAGPRVFNNSFFSADEDKVEYIAAYDSPALVANNVFNGIRNGETAIFQDSRSKTPLKVLETNVFFNVSYSLMIGEEASFNEVEITGLDGTSGGLFPENISNNYREDPNLDTDLSTDNTTPLKPNETALPGAKIAYQEEVPGGFEDYEGNEGGDFLGAYRF